ncbi:MAG: hypothetical protein JEZ06_21160 [Anaerolineaceae bacterium]|nr:hypothetical protein [Anaerolineaceae bacterium]
MQTDTKNKSQTEKQVSVEEVNRLLEVGKILMSVLTDEELKELQKLLSPENEIGNTGDS